LLAVKQDFTVVLATVVFLRPIDLTVRQVYRQHEPAKLRSARQD